MHSDRCVSRADQLGSLWVKKGKNCYPLQGFQGDSVFMWIRNARADWSEWGEDPVIAVLFGKYIVSTREIGSPMSIPYTVS